MPLEFEMHGQVKVVATIVMVIFLRFTALQEVEGVHVYHKLYINGHSHEDFDLCMTGFEFNSSVENVTIYSEADQSEMCDCIIYSASDTQGGARPFWQIQLYKYKNSSTETFDEIVSNIQGCGALHLNILNKTLILNYSGEDASVLNVGFPIQLRITSETPLHLQCSDQEFQNDHAWSLPLSVTNCHVTTISSNHVTEAKAPVMKQHMNRMPAQLQTILLAVLLPAIIIALVIFTLLFWRRCHRKKGDGTVATDTIEVRTPKHKNTHLIMHKYENVSKPGIVEVENPAPHVYDNVVACTMPETKKPDDGFLYAEVVKHITKSDEFHDVVL